MAEKPRFIDQDTFLGLLSELPRRRGSGTYGDASGDSATVYRDLSNFVRSAFPSKEYRITIS